MGLLDSFLSGSQGGYGGLLDALMYPSPLTKPEEIQQPQYDPMGNYTGITPQASNPFGQPPAFDPRQFAPQSVFNGNVPSSAVPYSAPMQPQAPALPTPQTVAPAPQPAAPQDMPDRTLSVGGYQMPQFGQQQAAQVQPSTDLSAQSRQAPALQDLPPAFGGGGYLSRINSGGSLIGSLLGDSPQQQNLKAEYDATRQMLIDNGVPAAKANSTAMLAVMNKDVGKTLLPELVTNKQDLKLIKNDFGGEIPYWADKIDHTLKPALPGGGAGGGAGGLEAISQKISSMRENGATREQLIKQIPQAYQGDVEALVTGKSIPANMGRAQIRSTLITLAHQVDPNFDETLIPTRVAMRKDFAGEGKNGTAIGNFNTAAHHIDKASDALERMAPYQGNYPTINAMRSYAASNLNSNPKLRDAAAELNNSMNAVDHEVAAAYNSGHLSDSDRQSWEKLKNSNLPPDVLRRGLSDFVDLLNGKRDSLNHMYRQTFHEDAPTIDKETNAAITAKVHSRLPGYAKEQTPLGGNQTKTGVSWSVVK